MIRFLSFLFNKPYEPCKSCETLKQQLEIVNRERQDLLDTMLSIVKPQPVVQTDTPIAVQSLKTTAMPWSQRRKILEQEDARQNQIRQESARIEKELGINPEANLFTSVSKEDRERLKNGEWKNADNAG